jgi:hypothetical protein
MVWAGFADSFIGCMNAKYHFSFWRPVTAIRNAGLAGNPLTVADPTWTPLGTTPNHPEFPAAHGCVTGSVARTLERFFGTDKVTLRKKSLALAFMQASTIVIPWWRDSNWATTW